MSYTVDIDTGGTFTDAYVTGQGLVAIGKADTTPHDMTLGVLAAIDRAATELELDRNHVLRSASVVRLSTTAGTNTLINRDGPKLGALVSDSLRELCANLPKELPLLHDMVEFITDDPSEEDHTAVPAAARALLERGARVIIVVLSGGNRLAAREQQVRHYVATSYPRHYLGAVPVLCSHQVTPIQDPRLRLQSAALNAYLHPVMSRFLYRVEDHLRKDGYRNPLLIANANGGVSRVAKTNALRTWGSGPAGGVAAAATMARHLELDNAVAFDVGGTSTDISVIIGGNWDYKVQPRIAGIDVSLPTLDLHSAAIGGGTIARVVDGALALGPDSAGAQPGPASFGLGGDEATVTDAACCLGYFDSERFLGGRKILDLDAARESVNEKVARPLGKSLEEAAHAILDSAAAIIADSIREQLADAGLAPSDTALLSTGGAGGLLAAGVRKALGAPRAYGFTVSPIFSAFGLSRLGILHTYETTLEEVGALGDSVLESMREQARRDMRGEGVALASVHFTFEVELLDADRVGAITVELETGEELEEFLDTTQSDRIRLVRLRAHAPAVTSILPSGGEGPESPVGIRWVAWSGQATPTATETAVYDWRALPPGAECAGPAVLETDETTLIVPPGDRAVIGEFNEATLTPAEDT